MATRGALLTVCRFVAQKNCSKRHFARLCSVRPDACCVRSATQGSGWRVDNRWTCRHSDQFRPTHRGYVSSHYDKWTELTYEDLVALMDSDDIQLIDVREPKELEETGAIPNSVNIPLGEIKGALKLDDARFTEHYRVAKPQHHDTNIVFYGLGSVKSIAALEIAHKLGFKKARHYPGGFDEWMTKQNLKH